METLYFRYKNWHYKNTTLLTISLVLFFYFADSPIIKNFVVSIGELGYLGAFVTGIFFVSTFTVAPAAVVIFHFANTLNPWEVALLAGAGSVLGDYIIFRFLRDKIFEELAPIFNQFGGRYLRKILRTPYFAWLAPVLGALIIASPFPDEIGIGLLGFSRLKNWQFLFVSFILNFAGIFAIVSLSKIS